MYKSSYKTIAAALRTALTRQGVFVGGTAGYPRVQLHSFVENTPQDKGGAVRVLSAVVETDSTKSAVDAATINDTNVQLLGSWSYTGTDFRAFGVVPTQLQEFTETSDPQQILYRVLQSIDIYVQQL